MLGWGLGGWLKVGAGVRVRGRVRVGFGLGLGLALTWKPSAKSMISMMSEMSGDIIDIGRSSDLRFSGSSERPA